MYITSLKTIDEYTYTPVLGNSDFSFLKIATKVVLIKNTIPQKYKKATMMMYMVRYIVI